MRHTVDVERISSEASGSQRYLSLGVCGSLSNVIFKLLKNPKLLVNATPLSLTFKNESTAQKSKAQKASIFHFTDHQGGWGGRLAVSLLK